MTKPLRKHPPKEMEFTGICECGCGGATPIATSTRTRIGRYKGKPTRFIAGHNSNKQQSVNGSPVRAGFCYLKVYLPSHRLANGAGYVLEHRLVWEEANGRQLGPDEQVHHIDGDRSNNSPDNLVALTNSAHQKEHGKSRGERLKQWIRDNPEEYRRRLSEGMRLAWATGARKGKRTSPRPVRDVATANARRSEGVRKAWAEGRLGGNRRRAG